MPFVHRVECATSRYPVQADSTTTQQLRALLETPPKKRTPANVAQLMWLVCSTLGLPQDIRSDEHEVGKLCHVLLGAWWLTSCCVFVATQRILSRVRLATYQAGESLCEQGNVSRSVCGGAAVGRGLAAT